MKRGFAVTIRRTVLLLAGLFAVGMRAEPVCIGETCYPSEEMALAAGVSPAQIASARTAKTKDVSVAAAGEIAVADGRRLAVGYMRPAAFLDFLHGRSGAASDANDLENHSLVVVFLLVLLGGLAANLTPCVLPLVPVNLMLVGRGWRRGAAYGFGIASAYGALGLAAAFGGLAFGAIQGNPWFNLFVAGVFAVLGCAMAEIFFIDFTKHRAKLAKGGPFLLGVGAAVLAGACVEPILLATLLLTAKWYAAGKTWAVVLPFILGAGMGLPWPFAAAGLSVLPKPGAWMKWVNRVFAALMFGLALLYAVQGVNGLRGAAGGDDVAAAAAAPADTAKPTLLILGAPWCKNCTAMEQTTLRDPAVVRELGKFNVRHISLDDFEADLKKLPDVAGLPIPGVPAYVILEPVQKGE